VLYVGRKLKDFNMRIIKSSPLAKYLDIKTAVYFDSRCVISPTENGLICIFREPNGIASKRQREWMHYIFDRVCKAQMKTYEISESKKGHFYLLATNEKIRKTGKDKSKSKPKTSKDIQG